MDATQILMVIGAGGIFALIVGFFMTGKSSKVMGSLTKLFQKKQKEKIDAIEEHQKTVEVNIKGKEILAKESKEKIIDIKKKATIEILDVLKKDNIGEIQKEIDGDWDEI